MNEKTRILVVDDDPHLLQGMSRILKSAGYETIEAATGTDCLRFTIEQKPDLVLLDVMLPDINGIEVCKRIKLDKTLADCYVVLLSSLRIGSDDQAEGLETGADGYIARPVSNRELLARVKALLRLKRAEEAIRKSEERFRRISSMTSDISYSCTKSNNAAYSIDWIMGAVEQITDHSEDDIIALGCWRNLVFDEDLPIFDSKVIGLAPGTSASCELRLAHNTGKVVWVASFAECVLDSGSPDSLRLYGALVDITERKQSEEALRSSEERFRKAFFLSPDAIIISRLVDGMIVSVNDGFKQLSGYVEEEFVGKTIPEINIWDSPEDRNRWIEKLTTEGIVVNFEFRFRTKDGDIRYGLMSASIIELNGVEHILNVAKDITERKQAEEEKESLRSQLLHAQKMEAIGTLAGGVAHDFNNLLQVALGYSEILLVGKNPDHPDYDKLHTINTTAKRGADLVQRLMVFSRKGDTKPRSLNLNHEVTQLKKLLERTIPKMIAIELSLESELPVINADPVQVEQILLNLAINAKDAMPESGGKLTIETRNITLDEEYCRMHLESKPGQYVMISVSDTGHGMTQETVQHIFEPFFTTKGAGKGTGLGLAMVYGIMKHHEGFINCKSEPNKGTTFRIYFPVVSMELEEDLEQESAVPQGGSETILLVDDEESLCDIGSQLLTRAGYTVLTATNARDALDLYRNQRSDISLVILDLIMPEMGGKECFKELVNINPQVRVILSSGFLSDGTTEEARVFGFRGLVEKPYNMRQLLGMVRDVLDGD